MFVHRIFRCKKISLIFLVMKYRMKIYFSDSLALIFCFLLFSNQNRSQVVRISWTDWRTTNRTTIPILFKMHRQRVHMNCRRLRFHLCRVRSWNANNAALLFRFRIFCTTTSWKRIRWRRRIRRSWTLWRHLWHARNAVVDTRRHSAWRGTNWHTAQNSAPAVSATSNTLTCLST